MNILSLSYGKDSLACIGACELLGWKIDRIVHAEVWATDTIPADLPPMVEFKAKADKIIKDRLGIEVEHLCAMRGGRKASYEYFFYQQVESGKRRGKIYGFPVSIGAWCNSRLKTSLLDKIAKGYIPRPILPSISERSEGGEIQGFPISINRGQYCQQLKTNIRISNDKRSMVQFGTENATTKFSKSRESEVVQYLGIAVDEPKRIERHKYKKGILLPLVEVGWTEADAKQWCIDNDLLSPIYTDKCLRGGCWFCHNQGVDQLRQLRHNYPQYWELLLKWDSDSPVTFHADGHTVHDFDKRFKAEDDGFINANEKFRWTDVENQQFNIFHYFNTDGTFKGFMS